MFDLRGKTALITGASSGLGAHIAGTLGRARAKVALLARSLDKLEAVKASLIEQGIEAEFFQADVTERAGLEQAIAAADDYFGGIDILVANAGIAATSRFLDMTEDEWSKVMDVDLNGVWRTGQITARLMRARDQGGVIINIASVLGMTVQPTQANYASAKAAVLHLTKIMARELGRYNIRVNAIAPGYFETEMNRDFFHSEAGEAMIAKLFPRRLGQLHELDGPLLLLASDASSYMTGTTLTVDGGTILSGV